MNQIEQIPGSLEWFVLHYEFCPQTGELLEVTIVHGPFASRAEAGSVL